MKINRILLILIINASLASCDHSRNHPGWDYFPDMAYSNAYETYTENPTFNDGRTMREPVEGTIPLHMIPDHFVKTTEDMIAAGKTHMNPLDANSENIARGSELYERFCLMCHGELGDGKGHLYTTGKYLVPPRTLVSNEMKAKPDGEIYHSITAGFGVMGEHGSMIKQEDRWKIILYIRNELQK